MRYRHFIHILSERYYPNIQMSNMIKFSRFFHPIPTNTYDLAISLFLSQYRPLTLFNNIQNNKSINNTFQHTKYDEPTIYSNNIRPNYWINTAGKKIQPLFKSFDMQFTLYPFQRLDHFIFSKTLNTHIFFTQASHNFSIEKYATSVKRKRRLKMNKHKFEKRRDRQRALRKRIGK
ncbi:hypothetical protein PCANB_001612 [Pneumocystis canis]|nr:hypothetical protein PCANB_001612 [Pneumocystis canis]